MNTTDVKQLRKELGMTQEEFAKELGVSRGTILNYERGEGIPETVVKLLNFLRQKLHKSEEFANLPMTSAPYREVLASIPVEEIALYIAENSDLMKSSVIFSTYLSREISQQVHEIVKDKFKV